MCVIDIQSLISIQEKEKKQARKLQATLEGCYPKLWLTYSLTDGGEV